MKEISYMVFMFVWFLGMAIAHSWWKILAIVFPPYGFYLTAEWLLTEVQRVCPL